MKNFKTKICKMLIAALVVLSMCTITAFAASTAKATSQVKFRTAVINKLNVPAGASAQVIRGNETLDAFEGMRLNSGDTVRTVGDATLYILVDQNKIIRLAKDTEVVLENTFLGTRVKMKLVKGSMFFNVVEKLPEDESLQFVYGNITISVRGTSAVLSGVDGAFGMLLTDGTVQATETLPNGEKVSAPVEAGTKFEYAAGDPEKGTQSVMKTSSFTLSELPPDVVEEMKNDENLKARIVESVPVSNGPSGPVYTTPDKVDLDYDCNKGEDTMEPSEEIAEKAQENQKGNGEVFSSGSSNDNSNTITVIRADRNSGSNNNGGNNGGGNTGEVGEFNGNNDDPDPSFICPLCQQSFITEDAHKHACGHYACEDGDHEPYECGGHHHCTDTGDHDILPCGQDYSCGVNAENLYMHQIIPGTEETMCQNPGKWIYCEGCGQYILATEFDSSVHALAGCGKHYKCEPGFAASEHASSGECHHYLCELEDFHDCYTKGCKLHSACKSITEWRKHLFVAMYNSGKYIGDNHMCCVGTSDYVKCPLCLETVISTEVSSGSNHLHYDAANRCITCNGERVSTAAFRELFTERDFTEEDVDEILEYLGMTLDPDTPE